MADLETLLREAAKRGITHLSLSPTPSEDGKKTYWSARATPSTEHKYIHCACEDPVDAVTQVLLAMPKAPRRTQRPEPHLVQSEAATIEIADQRPEFTAAVTEPPGQEPQAKTKTDPEPVTTSAPLNLEEEFASWLPKP